MKPRTNVLPGVILLLTVFLAACGGTPADTILTVNLPETGQTTSYDANAPQRDDGALQAGVSWPSPRFTNPDGTTPITGAVVVDQLTGLMWTQDGNAPDGSTGCASVTTMIWQDALDYVVCLNTNNYLGYTDWRLPNINELESLVNAEEANPATWLVGQDFTNVQAGSYWSATNYAFQTSSAWRVDMGVGYVFAGYKTSMYYAWPVRAGQTDGNPDSNYPANTWKTGQTTCYDASGTAIDPCTGTGQDGDILAGVAWPSPRFTDNGDGTVTDNFTGLMWTGDANAPGPGGCTTGTTMIWQDALSYVVCLNTNNYLGYTDWRLPNRKELHSLTDFSQFNPALQSGHPFTNVQLEFYWSATTVTSSTSSAWFVGMGDGYVYDGPKDVGFYSVLPVRAGQ